MRVSSALVAAALLLGAAVLFWPAADRTGSPWLAGQGDTGTSDLVEPDGPATVMAAIAPADARTGHSAFDRESGQSLTPASLIGSSADGQIAFDPSGRLVLDAELRRRFDYLLSAIGEWDLEQIRHAFKAQLQEAFSTAQVAAVMGEFDLYLAYLEALEILLPEHADLADQMAAMFELQHELLGPERAEALFGEENSYLKRTLDVMAGRIQAGDPTQDPFAADVLASTEHLLAAEMNRQYEARQTDPALRHVEREALFGSEAAERLAELDVQRAQWQGRVAAYAEARSAYAQQFGHDPAMLEQALADYRSIHFSPEEDRRIRGLERAGLIDDGD
ncbi:MAG: hypothetical protein EA370_15555 [Wenzhouxiangella sp.]|nr:MAG: hypothetical protein EA370_15555 [Wenzhouxiangella sp.]